MSELLLELFCEEIPARMQKDAEVAYKEIFTKYFKEHNLGFDQLDIYVGPRRLTITATGLPNILPAKQIEIKGPKVDAPKQAIDGFCNSYNVVVNQLEVRELKGNKFYFLIENQPAQDTVLLLQETLAKPVSEYVWPKSMFWGNYKIKWVRPLQSILCLFDGKVVPFEFGHLTASNLTFGHKFMVPDEIAVNNIADYKLKLEKAYVILDRLKRIEIIGQALQQEASKKGLLLKEDQALLEEVAGLAEYPIVFCGTINEKFLQVPSEVLVTSMRSHQKYFSTFNQKGDFAPYFLFVTNLISAEPELIIQGNEKVLSARLSDALYFYNQDLKTNLAARALKLETVVFHEKLGSLLDKVRRIEQICRYIEPANDAAAEAARLCKSDILSEIVGEFPELQGIMGYYYALAGGASNEVACAIRDHYKPVGANDSVARETASIVALADKIDSLCGLMFAGEKPTGSKDPYAVRRTALGLIRIILENGLKINLNELVNFVIGLYKFKQGQEQSSLQEILLFIEDRAKHYLKNSFDVLIIEAGLDLTLEPDLLKSNDKIVALNEFLKTKNSQDLLTCYKRANNIIGNASVNIGVKEGLFKSSHELELFKAIVAAEEKLRGLCKDKQYSKALEILSDFYQPLSNFFDNVLVKDEDKMIADNRIALLAMVKNSFEKVAKFDQL